MRLLSITHTPNRGGANISWIATLKGLKNNGVEILMIISEEGFMTKEMDKLSIPYKIVPLYFSVYPEINNLKDWCFFIPRLSYHEIINLKAVKTVCKIAEAFQPDIIHTNGSVVDVGLKAAMRLKIPHVWHLREYIDLDFNYHLIPSKRHYLNKIRTNSYSISITPGIFRHFKIYPNRGKVIFNGIIDKTSENGTFPRENFFIYVGVVTEGKGVSDLVNAFIEYRMHGGKLPLKIIGSAKDSYIASLKEKLSNNGINETVSFCGQIGNVYDYMRKAKAIIVPSKNEGFGRITAEAMNFGCLVIGRNTAGTKLQFDLGKEITGQEIGLRFSNEDELTNQMERATGMDDGTYLDITQRAKLVAESLYSTEENRNNTFGYLNSIVQDFSDTSSRNYT